MALERVLADIRAQGGVARMADPDKITEIQEAVTIPVMAKARIGHFVEAQILEALEVDYIDESDGPDAGGHSLPHRQVEVHHPVCVRMHEPRRGAAEDFRGRRDDPDEGRGGTGDIVNAVTHMRAVFGGIRRLGSLAEEELYSEAKNLQAPLDLVHWVASTAGFRW